MARKNWILRKKREKELDRLDFTDYAPDPVLEDEYFGGFHTNASSGASPWGRVWGRAPSRSTKSWAHEPVSFGLEDGQTPEFRCFLKEHGHWPKYRDKLPIWEQKRARRLSNEPGFAFTRQLVRFAEQKRPEVTPERDRADELDKVVQRLELLEEPTDLNSAPSRTFARGILREEKITVLTRWTERAIQKAGCSQFKPSKKLEEKRLPTLKRVASNALLTNSYLARTSRETKDEHRALLARLRVDGGTPLAVAMAPAEKTAAQLINTKMGRPSIGDRAMTAAERKRRSRANQKAKALSPQERRQPGAVAPAPPRPAVPGFYMMEEEIARMVTNLLDYELADKYHEYLGSVLDRLVDAPPDYILTRQEFAIVAAAGVLARRLLPRELH